MSAPRRIVLSRKGFDSSYGGVASPIFPDGALLSLPIPHAGSPHTYDELQYGGEPLGPLVAELTDGRVTGVCRAHLDPDLRPEAVCERPAEWRPAFGQCGAAQSHLAGHGVGPGDLFLFFGWFRTVEQYGATWRFVRGAPDLHVAFGWLQVGEALALGDGSLEPPAWLRYHPHFHGSYGANNTIYVARQLLELGGEPLALPGAGTMPCFRPALCLTHPHAVRRSEWRLPEWCFPRDGVVPLSYHGRTDRWRRMEDAVALASVPRGQEFVLDTAAYPEALPWARDLIAGTTG